MNRAVGVIMDVSVSEEFCLWERQQFEIFVTEQECLRVFIEDGIPHVKM
jgi:predicted GNAT family N-acyltransferase